jgi:hypothetical protein
MDAVVVVVVVVVVVSIKGTAVVLLWVEYCRTNA